MTFKEKTAYVLKYAPKGDEKIQKIIKAAANMDSPKSKLSADQKVKVKSAIEKLYDRFSEINKQQKTPASKKPYYAKAVSEFKKKVGRAAFAQATKGTTIAKDVELPAKKAGKRFPKAGQTSNQYGTFANKPKRPYWESRANRMDVNQPSARVFPKLAKGGAVNDASLSQLEKLKSDGRLVRYLDVRGNGKKVFDIIIPNKSEKGYFKRYESASRGSLGVLQNEYLDEQDVLNWLKKTSPNKMAQGGRTYGNGSITKQAIVKKYLKNEDNNYHSENVVLLAKHFGTKEQLQEAKEILQRHNKEGYLSSENGERRFNLHRNLIQKAREEMKKDGVEFAKGGRTYAKGGAIKGSPYTFDVTATKSNGESVSRAMTVYADNQRSAKQNLQKFVTEKLKYTNAKITNGRAGHEGVPKLKYAQGGRTYGNGGGVKRNFSRDRKYKSEQPHEKRYVRRSKPSNPRYERN